ncbi:MAG: hypothetical protein EBX41_00855 [Chitinophagia bacterium]|nr:hypothetical protein [Chitinophagia bacterium]
MIYELLDAAAPGISLDVLTNLINQSPVIAVLIIAIKYFYGKVTTLEKEVREDNEKTAQYLKDLNEKLMTTIQNNTQALNELINRLNDK